MSADSIKKIFGKQKSIAIGAIHLPPLFGYANFPGIVPAEKNALRDLRAFQQGGFDAVLFENNYDIPHREFVDSGAACALALVGRTIRSHTKLPVGINVLWNDYKTAFMLTKLLGLAFIRIPVFVDRVRTAYGIVEGQPKDVIRLREKLGCDHVALLTDIHIKHAALLSPYTLLESANRAIREGSDALIITGQWTGDAPDCDEFRALRAHVKNFPIFIGSGASEKNIRTLSQYANGVIVSTALKKGLSKPNETNVKSYSQRISETKARTFIRALHARSAS